MLEGESLIASLTIDEITRRVAEIAKRMHRLAEDFSVDLSNLESLKRLLINNPIDAFMQARGMGGVSYFTFDGRTFAFAFQIADPTSFGALIREILDWRLAQYLSRGTVADVICSVSRNASGNPILFLPSGNAGGTLPKGSVDVLVEGRPMEAVVAKIAVNVVRRSRWIRTSLSNILRTWFGDLARLSRSGRSSTLPQTRKHNRHGAVWAQTKRIAAVPLSVGGSVGFLRANRLT